MNKKFLALMMSIVLILTAAAPVSASAEIPEAAESSLEVESGEPVQEEGGIQEEASETTSSEEVSEPAEEIVPAEEGAAEEVSPAEETAGEENSDEEAASEAVQEEETPAGEDLPAEEEAVPAEEEPAAEVAAEVSDEETAEPQAAEEPAGENENIEETEEAEEELVTAAPAQTVGALSFTPAEAVDGKEYIIHSAKNPSYSLDVESSSYESKAKIQLYYNNGSAAQRFMLIEQSEGVFCIMNLKSGKVFDAAGGATQNRTQIQQYESNNTAAQKWIFVKNEDGSYTIQSAKKSTQVIDVDGGTMQKNQKIQLYASNNTAAQKFYLEEVTTEDLSGTIMLRPSSAQNMAAVPAGYSNSKANLQVTAADGSNDYHLYTIEKADHGFYTIRNVASGKVLDVAGGKGADGTNVQLYWPNNTNAQKWRVFKNASGTYSFYSKLRSELMLSAQDGGAYEGANLFVGVRNKYNCQTFCTAKVAAAATPDLSVWIESAKNSDRALTNSSKNLVSGDLTLAESQKLTIVPVSVSGVQDGYYVKLVSSDGLVVDVKDGKAQAHQNVRFYAWNGTDAQLWHLEENTDGTWRIVSKKNSGLCLDITNVSQDYGANIQLYTNSSNIAQKWHLASMKITSATISSSDHNTVTVQASGITQKSDDGKAYLFAVEPYVSSISGKSPVASTTLSSSIAIRAGLNKDSSASLLQKKLYVAIKQNGMYKVISNACYITNPEAAATNTAAIPTSSRGTKKGLKVELHQIDLAKSLKCSNVAVDIPIEAFIGSGYIYTYEGVKYSFSAGAIYGYKARLQAFKNEGITVTAIFYLSSKAYSYMMEPEARSGSNLGSATLLGINTRDSGRKTVEALYSCLAEEFTKKEILVSNWVMGNEVDQYINYNYSGDLGYNLYHESLAEQYRLFNAAIKSKWSNARCYISLDHNWNFTGTQAQSLSYRWYQGMTLLQDFNQDLTRQGKVHWDIAMHPYPSPEQDCRFWFRTNTVTNSGSSPQITMLNASYWASYIKLTYGSDVHICMSEIGLSSVYSGKDRRNEQAAAVAYAYYLAEFDKNIDTIDIHRSVENSGETKEGWYVGLCNSDGSEKPAANVFRYMDTNQWESVTAPYKSLVLKNSTSSYAGPSISDWSEVVPGFSSSFLNGRS